MDLQVTFPSLHGQLWDQSTKCPAVLKGCSWSFNITAMQKCVTLVSDSLFVHFFNNSPLPIMRETETNFQREKALMSMYLLSPMSAQHSTFIRSGQLFIYLMMA